MPVTKGHGNADWLRDETILALDLLYRHGRPLDRRHPEVLALSELLRGAELVPASMRRESFRNPDGVALKLQNLQSALDPERRLSSSRTDRKVVEEFPRTSAAELRRVAVILRSEIGRAARSAYQPSDDLEEFPEGRLLTRMHTVRERDPIVRKKLLAKREGAALVCEACGLSEPHLDRALEESLFEAHHLIPLADGATRATRLADMALLCACCHRLIHKLIITQRRWVEPEEVGRLLRATKATPSPPGA
jgi:5-methylcytosine-specific restriction protein A